MVAVWGVAAEHTADTEAQSTAFSSFALLNRYVVPRAPRVLDLDISWRARRYLAVMGAKVYPKSGQKVVARGCNL
eukprot:scaffold249692_cov26-Tisochrysis_lutea.AAC.2